MLSQGFNFTALAGGGGGGGGSPAPVIAGTAQAAGVVFVANDGPAVAPLQAAGWELIEEQGLVGLAYGDALGTRLSVLRRALAAGEHFEVPQDGGWSGCILLFRSTDVRLRPARESDDDDNGGQLHTGRERRARAPDNTASRYR